MPRSRSRFLVADDAAFRRRGGGDELHATRRRARALQRGLTLIELLVVLAILAGMIALLMPAVQSAREAGRTSVCQNNIRQLAIAARSHAELTNRFPEPGEEWTVTLLEWMEERPLQDALTAGNLKVAIGSRPRIFRCPSQSDPPVDDTGIRTTHYLLEVGRRRKGGTMRFNSIRDRAANFEGERILPWYRGPIGGDTSEGKGPHGGLFNRS